MTQHTSRLRKGYLKESDGVLHHSAASYDLVCTVTRPQPNWDDLGWVGPQSEGKAANKCSAYMGTPSRLLEKHSRGSWLRYCQECAKVSSRQRVATLKNLFNTFLVPTCFHMCYFIVLMSSLLFYNVENSKMKKNHWMSRCVRTFDWYCTYFSILYLKYQDAIATQNKITILVI